MLRHAGFSIALSWLLLAPSLALAQIRFAIPDAAGDRIMLFDQGGSLVNANWITDVGQAFEFTTPVEATQIGVDIWVSDQDEEAVHRFGQSSSPPAYLGSITTDAGGNTLDNIRGFGHDFDRQQVFLTRDHANPALRGTVVIRTDTATPTGFFPAREPSDSLWDAEMFGADLLISNRTTGNIERINRTTGAFVENFATGLAFPQQVVRGGDTSIVTVASSATPGAEGIYHFNPNGTLRRFIDTDVLEPTYGELAPHGVWLLNNGTDYLLATSVGVFRWWAVTRTFTQSIGGVDAQYIGTLYIPEPGFVSAIALAMPLALRRRRRAA